MRKGKYKVRTFSDKIMSYIKLPHLLQVMASSNKWGCIHKGPAGHKKTHESKPEISLTPKSTTYLGHGVVHQMPRATFPLICRSARVNVVFHLLTN